MKMNLWFEPRTEFNKRKYFVNFIYIYIYVLVSKEISRYFKTILLKIINAKLIHRVSDPLYYIELIILDKLFSLIHLSYLSINLLLDLSREMKVNFIRDKIFLAESIILFMIEIFCLFIGVFFFKKSIFPPR